METLNFRFENHRPSNPPAARLVGVVSSGNLEVLIEPVAIDGACEVEVKTAAIGFRATWQAVISDFNTRWMLGDTRISIND